MGTYHTEGLVQDGSIFSALIVEVLQSCTKPSIYCWLQPMQRWHKDVVKKLILLAYPRFYQLFGCTTKETPKLCITDAWRIRFNIKNIVMCITIFNGNSIIDVWWSQWSGRYSVQRASNANKTHAKLDIMSDANWVVCSTVQIAYLLCTRLQGCVS